MKVLITTDWYKPVVNGVVTSVLNLAQVLQDRGHEVRILTLSSTHHSYKEGNVTYIASVGVGKIYPNARVRTAPPSPFIRELIEWKPDVVHSQCEFSTFLAARHIAKKCNAPLIHTYHTVYEDYTHYYSPSARLGRYMAAHFSKWILNKTEYAIVPTEKVHDLLEEYGVDTPVAVIPSGIEMSRFQTPQDQEKEKELRHRLGIEPEDMVLVYLGRLAQEKNIQELFQLIRARHQKSLKLLLVGDGPYRQELEEAVQQMQIQDQVIFAGMVSPEEVNYYYHLGDVFVSASQSETQGLTYIEAMASGLPILCKDDPCLDEVVENGENGFTYASPEEFETVLDYLLEDRAARQHIGKKAVESTQENYSTEAFAREVDEIYAQAPKDVERKSAIRRQATRIISRVTKSED